MAKFDWEKVAKEEKIKRQGWEDSREGEANCGDRSDGARGNRPKRHPGFIKGKDGDRRYYRCKRCKKEIRPALRERHVLSCRLSTGTKRRQSKKKPKRS